MSPIARAWLAFHAGDDGVRIVFEADPALVLPAGVPRRVVLGWPAAMRVDWRRAR